MNIITTTNIRKNNVLIHVGTQVTSSGLGRGVPNTLTAVKGTDFTEFSDNSALLAQIGASENNTDKQKLFCGTTGISRLSLVTSSLTNKNVMQYLWDDTGGPPSLTQMYFAGYPGQPTTNRSGSVSSSFTEFAAYIEVSYSPGWTTDGSNTGSAKAYKLTAVGMNNYGGRCGIEWTNTSGYSYTMGLSGWAPDQPANNGNGDALPYSITSAGGVWVTESIVCHAWYVTKVNDDVFKMDHWTYLKGTEPTINPQSTLSYSISASSLAGFPTYDRLTWGENFNQSLIYRYMPTGSYVHWHAGYIWDRQYDNNPLNL